MAAVAVCERDVEVLHAGRHQTAFSAKRATHDTLTAIPTLATLHAVGPTATGYATGVYDVIDRIFSGMRRRTRTAPSARRALLCAALLLLATVPPAYATNHITRLEQLMVGANGDTAVQFLEMKFLGSQNNWANVSRLRFHDESGSQTGVFVITENPPGPPFGPPCATGGGVCPQDPENTGISVLIATQAFVDLTGLAADILLPAPMMSPTGGMVCFEENPVQVNFSVRHCLSYGGFPADVGFQESDVCGSLNGPPAPALPFAGAPMSLNRFEDVTGDFECGHENANFRLEPPTPRNANGDTAEVGPSDAQIAFGELLFTTETFAGNGRTCATCHAAAEAFGLTPAGVEERFIADPQEPLFIAENDAQLSDLENACLMRDGDQRALILENIDGFANDPVFRGSPHLLNLALTAPYGLSGEEADLRSFSTGAVRQHFTKTLARGAADFRLPTQTELEALEAFMNSIAFPADGNLDLERMIDFDIATNGSNPAQIQRGRDLFFGPVAQCSTCHSGPVLADADGSLGTGTGNLAFNTGVVNRFVNQDDGCIGGPGDPTLPLPAEAGGNRAFSTPPLVGIATTAPFFHDNSAETLTDAVQFYDSLEFKQSPAAALLSAEIVLPVDDVRDIVAFLEAISIDPTDNCPGVSNPDQADSNGDGAGDACQPTVDVAPVVPQGDDLFAEIAIADPNDDPLNGVVQVIGGANAPVSITFEAFKTTCNLPAEDTDLLLNGVVIGTIPGDPLDCACIPGGPTSVEITGNVIGANWNFAGANALRVVKPETGNQRTLLTWAKATLFFDDRGPEEVCIHNVPNGPSDDCSEQIDLCRFNTSFVAVDETSEVELSTALVTEAYADSQLPAFLDISALDAGDYLLRATTTDGKTPEVDDVEPFTKNAEALLFTAPPNLDGELVVSFSVEAGFGNGTLDGEIVRPVDAVQLLTGALEFSAFPDTIVEDIDAFHILPEGAVVFSTSTDVTQGFGGIPNIRNGDLVLWDGVEATLLFSELIGFGGANNNIDAFSILPNGNWLLSTDLNATLGGLFFQNGDIVEYDPDADIATLHRGLDEATIFTGVPNSNPDVDALHVRSDGRLILSIRSDGIGRVGTGPTYVTAEAPRTDLFEIDPETLEASLLLDGSGLFDGLARNLDAVALTVATAPPGNDGDSDDPEEDPIEVPEPGLLLQLTAGAVMLSAMVRRRSRGAGRERRRGGGPVLPR